MPQEPNDDSGLSPELNAISERIIGACISVHKALGPGYEEKVNLELKSVESLNPLFTAQVISYLCATRLRLALLINFNTRKLIDGIKRIAN